jgi:hypothetical protein
MKINHVAAFYLLMLCSFLLLPACKKRNFPKADLRDSLLLSTTDFEFLSAKANLDFSLSSQNAKAKTAIRMQKDSLMWLSIGSSMGIEVLRVQATPEYIAVINRDQQTYQEFSFQELSNRFSFPLSFNLLQNLLIGDMPVKQFSKSQSMLNNDEHIIRQEVNGIEIQNYVSAATGKLNRLIIKDTRSGSLMDIVYQDYTLVDGVLFPYHIKAQLHYQNKENAEKQTLKAEVEYQKIELSREPLRFPFKVPSTYQKTN